MSWCPAWSPFSVPRISFQPLHPCLAHSDSSSSSLWASIPDSVLPVPQTLPTPFLSLAYGTIFPLVSMSCSKHGACDSSLPAAPCNQTFIPLAAATGAQVSTCLADVQVAPWHTARICSPEKWRDVQTCSMGLASSQTVSVKG